MNILKSRALLAFPNVFWNINSDEPPYTERYVRWCERTPGELITRLLLDFSGSTLPGPLPGWYNEVMKHEIMPILVCPVCKGKLELKTREEKEAEIVSGSLYCNRCKVNYPITDGIPNLLPPDTHN